MSHQSLRVVPLGGLGEYGMNCMVLESQNTQVMVDCGVLFPDEEHLGLDLIIPDFGYMKTSAEEGKTFLGLIVTHGHEDHIGAIPYLIKEIGSFPIYGTAFTIALIKRRLEEHNLVKVPDFHEIKPNEKEGIGPFGLEPIHVNHSCPSTVALALRTPAGVIIATGDWRVDHTPISEKPIDLATLGAYGQEGVLALIADSTNIDVPGSTDSETEVVRNLEDMMDLAPHRIFITMFSSHMWRVQGVINAAHRVRRKVMLVGRSMQQNFKVARDMGIITVPSDDIIVDVRDFRKIPPEELVVLIAGSQGEWRSSLSRMARGEHRQLNVQEGDWVVYSCRVIPGNEKAVARVRDQLWKRGAEIHTSKDRLVHTSGHGKREELKLMIRLTKPQVLIPVHGEYQQMFKHSRLGRDLGVRKAIVLEDGDVLELYQDGGAERVEGVETGKVFVDGSGVGDVEESTLKARRHMASSGAVITRLVVSKDTGKVLLGPEIDILGVAYDEDDSLLALAVKKVHEAVRSKVKSGNSKPKELEEAMRLAARRFFRKELRRKPYILPLVDVI